MLWIGKNSLHASNITYTRIASDRRMPTFMCASMQYIYL